MLLAFFPAGTAFDAIFGGGGASAAPADALEATDFFLRPPAVEAFFGGGGASAAPADALDATDFFLRLPAVEAFFGGGGASAAPADAFGSAAPVDFFNPLFLTSFFFFAGALSLLSAPVAEVDDLAFFFFLPVVFEPQSFFASAKAPPARN